MPHPSHKQHRVTQLFLLAPIEVETPQDDRREDEELQRIAGAEVDAGKKFVAQNKEHTQRIEGLITRY